MRLSRICAAAVFLWVLGSTSEATIVVHDPVHTVLNIAQQVYGQVKQELQHAEDITKYTTMIQKQLEQIDQLTNIINQDIEQLRRFGNPDTYVNMLGLDELFEEVNNLRSGVGRTVSDFSSAANGIAALKYTGQGLYQDLSRLPDKFDQHVAYNVQSFKKFGILQDMNDDYNRQLNTVNQSFNRLENDLRDTAGQLNSAGSLVETQKLQAKLQALQGAIESNTNRASLAALKVLVQSEVNRNDQARVQKASRQRHLQEIAAEDEELSALGGKLLGPPSGN
jgi:hypothetical protein